MCSLSLIRCGFVGCPLRTIITAHFVVVRMYVRVIGGMWKRGNRHFCR